MPAVNASADIATTDEETPPRCECIGGCCAASPVVLAVVQITPIESEMPAGRTHAAHTPESAPSRELAHRLPFANGPPAPVS